MKKAALIIPLLVLTILASGCIGREQDPTVITGKTTISESGTYVLNSDISCTLAAEGVCIEIRANSAVLDCQDHSITLENPNIRSPATSGIFVGGVNDVTVRNCRIEKFSMGVFLKGSHNNFINNTINNNDMGIYYDDYSSYNGFINNTVSDNGKGIYFFMRSSNNTFTGNTIRNNGAFGIIITCAAHHNSFSNNAVEGNGYGGFGDENGGVYILNSYANVFSGNRICNNSITVRCKFDPRMESTTEMCWLQALPHTVPIDGDAQKAGVLIDGGNNVCEPAGPSCGDTLECNEGCAR